MSEMNRQYIYYNKTFSIGENAFLNACVGSNGIQDHTTYGLGYDQATKHLIDVAKKKLVTPVDSIIHPIVFCARHRIELFLKDQLFKFNIIRTNIEITEHILISTHDLNSLWSIFKSVGSTTDRRFCDFINEADEYILDFAEIDPTGETFRYPYDKFKNQHLIETPLINIEIFEKRYVKLSDMMADFGYLTEFLIEEYCQNTYTNELSREDIREISNTLPNTDEWTKASFNDIKEEIRKKYGLSNRKLSRVIDIIKAHREFCSNIGLEKPLAELSETSLIKYINIYNSFISKRYPTSAKNTPPKHINLKTYNKYAKELISSLPRESIICIYTLIELGKLYEYGEQYEHVYSEKNEQAKEEYFFSEYVSYILYNAKALKFIYKALQMTGQKTLTDVLQGLAWKT